MTYKELLWFALRRTSDNQLIFNFTCLDGIIQMLHDLNLMPGFEMMGNPSGYFTDLEDHFQIMLFADLAFQLASRYIGLFYYYCYFRWGVIFMDLSICVQDTLKSYQLILINILRDGLGMVQERCD